MENGAFGFYLKELNHYLKLNYPLSVTYQKDKFVVKYPDLTGCEMSGPNLEKLYSKIERLRQTWIENRLQYQIQIPMPNSHLCL